MATVSAPPGCPAILICFVIADLHMLRGEIQ